MKILILLLLASLTASSAAEDYEEFRRKCHYSERDCKKEWNEKKGDERAARVTEEARARAALDRETRQQQSEQFDIRMKAKREAEEARYQETLAERTKKLAGKKKDPNSSCNEQWPVNGEYRDMPCDPDNKSPIDVAYEEQMAALKRKCGKDAGQLRVGMTLERFEDCNGTASFVTDTVGKGGVVETWRATFYWLHVQNGRIVGYTRRPR